MYKGVCEFALKKVIFFWLINLGIWIITNKKNVMRSFYNISFKNLKIREIVFKLLQILQVQQFL